MFTQRVSMDCTEAQYNEFLKEPLLKMGYKFGNHFDCSNKIIVNDYCQAIGHIGITTLRARNNGGRKYLGSFNAPLFLALAAMTDKAEGNYGEYYIGLLSKNWYSVVNSDKPYFNYKNLRKATKEEIMAKFGDFKIGKINYEVSIDTKGIIVDISKALGATDEPNVRVAQLNEQSAIGLLKELGYIIFKRI